MKLSLVLVMCFLASAAFAGNNVIVESVERPQVFCRDVGGKRMCETDSSTMIFHVNYGGCNAGQLALDVELGPIEEGKDYDRITHQEVTKKVVRSMTVLVKNEKPSNCEMAIRTTFEIDLKDAKELALKKLKAIDPEAALWVYGSVKLGNPLSAQFD